MAAPTIAVNDVLALTLRGRLHGQRTINTYYYKAKTVDAAAPTNGYDALTQIWILDVLPDYEAATSQNQTYEVVRVKKIFPIPFTYNDEVLTNRKGLLTVASVPSTVAAILKRRNLLAGRRFMGRVFIPGIPENGHLNSVLTAAQTQLLLTLANSAMDTDLISGAWTFEPVHWVQKDNTGAVPIDNLDVVPELANQRRRRVGRGE